MGGAHSLFSPSGAHRWLECHGSTYMEQGKPDDESEYAAEGTAAHELAATCLKNGQHPSEYLGQVINVGERKYEVDVDMAGNVNVYVQFVRQQRDLLDGLMVVEQKVDYSRHVALEGQGGSLDCGIWAGNEIQVHDLKYGMGEMVDAVENKQLMLYALGLWEEWKMFVDDDVHFRIFIHQPRIHHEPTESTCTLSELLTLAAAAKVAVHRALIPIKSRVTDEVLQRDYLRPGDKTCRWCKAKATCPALADHVLSTIGASFDDLSNPLVDLTEDVKAQVDYATRLTSEMSEDHVAHCMSQVDLIEVWCRAIRAEVERRLTAGIPVPHYKLVKGRKGNRYWLEPNEVEWQFGHWRIKHEEMYKYALISPTDAERLLKKDKPKWWAKIQEQIGQHDGKLSVAHESDKRASETVDVSAEDFEDVTQADIGDLVVAADTQQALLEALL